MLQRGKGGGLAGALGGMGGQSAFGTKAGDLFTKITVGVAAFWILISVFAAIYAPPCPAARLPATPNANAQQNPGPGAAAPPAGKPADSAAGKSGKPATAPARNRPQPAPPRQGCQAASRPATDARRPSRLPRRRHCAGNAPGQSRPATLPAQASIGELLTCF